MSDRFRRVFPQVLLWSRLALAPFVPMVGFLVESRIGAWLLVSMMVWAVVSDVFDGVLARRWGTSSVSMRRWDSTVDTIFWLAVLATVVGMHPRFFSGHKWPVGVVLGLELSTYVVSWARFGREPATHSLAAKFWSLLFFAFLTEIVITGRGDIFWWPCAVGAVYVRLEVVAILLAIREWASDIPHLGAAMRLRRGLDVKRNRLFNG